MLRLADLAPYQDRVISDLYERNYAIVRIKMGGGKTVIFATLLTELHRDGHFNRALILAPPRVAKHVWPEEFQVWEHLDPDMIAFATGDVEQRIDAIDSGKPLVVLSFNNVPWFFDAYGKEHGFDCLAIDELTKLKSRGVWFKALSRRKRDFKIRIGGTGTFISEGVEDAWAQAFLIDEGRALGKTVTGFKNEYYDYIGPNHWNWEPKPDAVDRVTEALASLTIQIDGAEYEDQLPPLRQIEVKVDLPLSAREKYRDLFNEYVAELDDGTEIEAVNAGVKVGKLQQIADGFLYHPSADGGPPTEWTWLHNAKLDALEELLEEADGEPLLVAYQYRAELDQLLKRWPGTPYLGAGVSDKAAAQRIREWNKGRLPMFLIHPQSAAHGLNLQKGGNKVVWFGFTWSLDEYDQLIARLRRKGQPDDTVYVYRIIAEETVDESIAAALADKRSVQQAVYEGLGIRY